MSPEGEFVVENELKFHGYSQHIYLRRAQVTDVIYDNREIVTRAERYRLPAQAAMEAWDAVRLQQDTRFDATAARSTMLAASMCFLGPLDAKAREDWLARLSQVLDGSAAAASAVENLDPQLQGRRWLVAELARETNFLEVKASDPDVLPKLQRAMAAEYTIVLQDCQAFPPVLLDLKPRPKKGAGLEEPSPVKEAHPAQATHIKSVQDFHHGRRNLRQLGEPLALAVQSAWVISKVDPFYAPSIPQISTTLAKILAGKTAKITEAGHAEDAAAEPTKAKELSFQKATTLEVLRVLARPMERLHRLPLAFLTSLGMAEKEGFVTEQQLELFWEAPHRSGSVVALVRGHVAADEWQDLKRWKPPAGVLLLTMDQASDLKAEVSPGEVR
eukprot:g27019.t1